MNYRLPWYLDQSSASCTRLAILQYLCCSKVTVRFQKGKRIGLYGLAKLPHFLHSNLIAIQVYRLPAAHIGLC